MRKFLALLLLLPTVLLANVRLSDQTRVSVLTCGSGNQLYSLFGHTAIRINDPQLGLDVVYNYGAFDFSAPNFVARFTKGNLQYFVATDTFNGFLNQYQYEGRRVVEQELFITTNQKQRLFDELSRVLNSDERFYTYKFIDRNCTNMAMAVINKILGETALKKTGDTAITYREILYPYFNRHFFEQWGTSLIFGTKVDENATTLFLPSELEKSLETATYQGKRLSQKSDLILPGNNEMPSVSWGSWAVYLLLMGAISIANKKWLTLSYFSIIGLIGVFFCVAGWYSLHAELAYNYNVLLCNPLLLGVVWALYKNSSWLKTMAWICIGMLAVYLPIVAFKTHFLIVLPMMAAHGYLLGRIAVRKTT